MKVNADPVRVSAEKVCPFQLAPDLHARVERAIRKVLVLKASVRNAIKDSIRPINSKSTVSSMKIPPSLFV